MDDSYKISLERNVKDIKGFQQNSDVTFKSLVKNGRITILRGVAQLVRL
jgi:hypothetical protein